MSMSQPQTHITATSALQSWVEAFRSLSWMKGSSRKTERSAGASLLGSRGPKQESMTMTGFFFYAGDGLSW